MNTVPEYGNTARRKWAIIMPAIFFMYMISFFDRVNIGMALPHITKEMSLSSVQGGWIGASFAWGYLITQLLAGYLAVRFGPRQVIGCCLILFGGIAAVTGFARSFEELLAIRFLLGLSEGPIYAACSMILAQWFIKSERGRAFGIWNLSVAVGGFLAGPVSAYILASHDWRAMMVIEGLPAWLFCLVWFVAIPRSLDAAKWLSASDRESLKTSQAAEQADHKGKEGESLLTVFKEPSVWLLMLGFSCSQIILYGLTLWLPTIFKSYDQLSGMMVGMLSGAPFIMAMIGSYYITYRSDKHQQERRYHAAVPLILMGLILTLSVFIPPHLFYLQIALIMVVGFMLKMPTPLISSYLTEILPLRKAISAVGVVIGGGSFMGQFLGPLLVGYMKSIGTGFAPSFVALGVVGVMGGCLLMAARPRKSPALSGPGVPEQGRLAS